MPKKFLLSVVVILWFSSAGLAGIGQAQCFSIGAVNLAARCGGHGSAQSLKIAIVGQKQKLRKSCFGTVAVQKEVGILGQYASVGGRGGMSVVVQNATVRGRQGQLAPKPLVIGRGPTAQRQTLNISLGQRTVKNGGIGGATGVQGFVGGQTQKIVTPHTTSTQSQCVGAVQYSNVSGGPRSNIEVGGTLDIKMRQGQTIR